MEASRHVIEASKRPTSMAVPLPSWAADGEDRGRFTTSSKSIAVSDLVPKCSLHKEYTCTYNMCSVHH